MGHNIPHTEKTKLKISQNRKGKGLGNVNGFKKGHTPWHKDTKGLSKGGVKKDNIPWNKGKKLSLSHKLQIIKNLTPGWGKGKKRSLETRQKMRLAKLGKAGEYANNWQGGITSINHQIRNSQEYKLWRSAVFERDNYICIWCSAQSAKGKKVILHADHIKPFAYYPELRFAIDNGRTLCIDCHKTTDTYLSKKKL